jgi:corrinoid protein of di/trimethylamine methyltransferase
MSREAYVARAVTAVREGDEEAAVAVAEDIISDGLDPLEFINDGFAAGMSQVGELFASEEISLPEVIVAAEAMRAGMAVLEARVPAGGNHKRATVVLGVAEGDMHDIGKRIVATMLGVNGFEVIDIGRDVPAARFIEEVRVRNAEIVGCSALMTNTMMGMQALEDGLRQAGMRDRVKTMIGGAATTQHFADKIGADAWAENANQAVEKAKELAG